MKPTPSIPMWYLCMAAKWRKINGGFATEEMNSNSNSTQTRMESGLTVSRKQKKRSADNTASGENATTAAPLPLLISFA